MNTLRPLMEYLKQHGPSTIKELKAHLGLSETAVRHQLHSLEKSGWLEREERREGRGRPTTVYRLTQASEGLFPKRYPELLDAVLAEAEREQVLERLLEGVAESMAAELRRKLEGLEGPAKLRALLTYMDYGDMLGTLEETPAGWELKAYNCLYYATGQRFESVCNLPPRVITKATGLPAERPFCQRDGHRACHFFIANRSP
ncbi:helix-turn-helix transcriptional regulator [Meiothermus sp. CFH 77666]|uniref:helix-turn-helix transcriptional regulator n=1 Tax=Meiothermus sp. CFH 77666 TaxID=2817942 RepID=UPI001AA08572|nr:helix-turn-helix transcriptional regulator [Meiothermus sp. CFH 77666]MBO1436062.1 helix-turn-helix transcriptional regulator [Meiothermus sp. CFH 77666]